MTISKFDYIFFDFDGVIKESVNIKAEAFLELFESFGHDISRKIHEHHLMHGGMSRFEKIELYLTWLNESNDKNTVEEICNKFSYLVKEKVIKSAWVPGIETFLRKNLYDQTFILISATPQKELEEICQSLNLTNVFSRIIGWPASKTQSINEIMLELDITPDTCLMIGDYISDFNAAKNNGISFLFRRHQFNNHIKMDEGVKIIKNFIF